MVNSNHSRRGIMQITDSLAAGGMERVAVNLANLMPRDRYRNYLCTTRCEGPLADLVNDDVGRLRLQRQRRFDRRAVGRLVEFIRTNEIQILHAHGTALFMADLASFFAPYPKVIWHDHCGRVERPVWLYRLLTRRAAGVLAVNQPLANWSRSRLQVPPERVWYIPNFVREGDVTEPPPQLPGDSGARVVCVANLRPEKDHLTLIRAMSQVVARVPAAHALFVGGGGEAAHVHRLKQEIRRLKLDRHISLLGERHDIPAILRQSDIGVLSSAWEGLPLSLLEYGLAGLPAVVTRVGQCPEVVEEGRCGIVVSPGSPDELAQALLSLLASEEQRGALGQGFRRRVHECYTASSAIAKIGQAYETVLQAKAGQS